VQAVVRGALLVGATRDATFPMPDGPWPGTGAILAAVETAVGREASTIIGKPELTMYQAARDRLGEGRILGVGDRPEIDVLGARRAGFDQALVRTGGASRNEAEAAEPRATYIADSLATLVLS
jgi:ribonucleotide monophosphatase NagD (HAD superfamily)